MPEMLLLLLIVKLSMTVTEAGIVTIAKSPQPEKSVSRIPVTA